MKNQKVVNRQNAVLFLNGVRHEITGRDHWMMLADWLRKEQGLTGTKIVCAEGDCGACTVLKACPSNKTSPDFRPINSCIAMVGQLDGCSLVTIEGIATNGTPSPIQDSMTKSHASQCGYCTPGFVMALTGLVEKNNECLTGNLCRCTGYQPILESAAQARPSVAHLLGPRYLTRSIELSLLKSSKTNLKISTSRQTFFAPIKLQEALKFLSAHRKTAKIIAAGTDLAVPYNKGKDMPTEFLSLHLISELAAKKVSAHRISIGARVSLEEVRKTCQTYAPEFARLLNVFASPQIKNAATLAGNIVNASPIGDTMPYLLIADCKVHVASWKRGSIHRRIIALDKFYMSYKKTALRSNELVTHISFATESNGMNLDSISEGKAKNAATIKAASKMALPHKAVTQRSPVSIKRIYKVSARKDLDISAVSTAFYMSLSRIPESGLIRNSGKFVISDVRIAVGGVAEKPIRAEPIEDFLTGNVYSSALLDSAAIKLANSVAPLTDTRGTSTYRQVLVKNLFGRFSRELSRALEDAQAGQGALPL
ncbi:MAG: FAD binding domain-containing protein [Proteobacteria bacterium]|nr:FAD binding domain-containing protein [Pseudomonadota bacterium]